MKIADDGFIVIRAGRACCECARAAENTYFYYNRAAGNVSGRCIFSRMWKDCLSLGKMNLRAPSSQSPRRTREIERKQDCEPLQINN